MLGIADGVRYLHQEKKVLHRDLKPENILMKDGRPLIADLGISKILKTSGSSTRSFITPFYMAPEMMESAKYGFSVDIWALGLVFFEVCLGELLRDILSGFCNPCQRLNFPPEDLLGKIKESGMRKLVTGMLKKDVASRLRIDQVIVELSGSTRSPNEPRRGSVQKKDKPVLKYLPTISPLAPKKLIPLVGTL